MKKQLLLTAFLTTAAFGAQPTIPLVTFQDYASTLARTTAIGAAVGAVSYLTSVRPGYYAYNKKEFLNATAAGAAIGTGLFAIVVLSEKLGYEKLIALFPLGLVAITLNAIHTNQPKKLPETPKATIGTTAQDLNQ